MRGFMVACLLSFIAPGLVVGQTQQPPIEMGQRVRMTAPAFGLWNVEGTFGGVRGEDVIVVVDSSLAVPRAKVQRLDRLRGRRGHPVRGFALGGLLGGLVGAVLMHNAVDSDECAGDVWPASCIRYDAIGFAGGAMVGGLIGSLVGVASMTDWWEEVPVDRLRAAPVVALDGRLGLALSVSF